MSKFLKTLLLSLIIFLGLFNFSKNIAVASESTFIVTAYYSPLPNQKHYSYNYYKKRDRTFEEEKRLQGEGHTTASGKPVSTGILAAPSKYPFGTKIYFHGYGIGTVEDRGGAIVKAGKRGHEHDRIDIWMGYGDEGLQRALKWGKKTVKGNIVSRNSKITLKYSKNILNGIENIKVNPEFHKVEDVKKLQENFKKLGLYNGNIDGRYNSIKKDLVNFQIKNKIISSKYDESAGRFGPKTYVKLLKIYGNKEILIKEKEVNVNIKKTNPKIEIILQAPEIRLNGDEPQREEIIKVQNLFKKIGLYNGKIDGDFETIKYIILKLQKDSGIIKNNNDWGAGYFGEKTKAALIDYCENNFRKETINRKKITYTITNNDKKLLNKIVGKINIYIKKKAGIDVNRKKTIKKQIENKLISIKNRAKKEKLKIQIDYILKNI